MYRHILVPTDGSPLSARAEKAAIEMARKFKARITVAHIVEPWSPRRPSLVPGVPPPSKLEYEKQVALRGKATTGRVLARMRRAKVQARAVVESDDSPGDALVRLARLGECDLIVMASHSRSGIERILLGSVASEVVNGTKTAVLICH